MLILTRCVGESVKIGDEVTVTVLGVKGVQVRLGFAAPEEVAVHREEIYERMHRDLSTLRKHHAASSLQRPFGAKFRHATVQLYSGNENTALRSATSFPDQ